MLDCGKHNLRVMQMLDEGHCLRDQVLEICGTSTPSELGDFRASSLGTLVQMVAGGDAITLLPGIAVLVEAQGEELRTVPFRKPAPSRTIGLAWRRQSPRSEEFKLLGAALRMPGRKP